MPSAGFVSSQRGGVRKENRGRRAAEGGGGGGGGVQKDNSLMLHNCKMKWSRMQLRLGTK